MSHLLSWSWPVVAEQFFIGIAAGCFFIAVVMDLFGQRHKEVSRLGFYVTPIATIIGLIILDLELGRPERGINALLNPATSMISRGSYVLMVFFAVALIAAVAWAPGLLARLKLTFLAKALEAIRRPLEVVGLALAIFVGLYAGLQIGWAVQRQFWFTPFLPWLYFVSALSLSLGALGLIGVATRKPWVSSFMPTMAQYVIYLIIAQALMIAGHFATTEGAGREVQVLFTSAALTPAFLIGVFLAGIIGPAILSYYAIRSGTLARGRALTLFALLVIGAFSIRAVFLFTGQLAF